MSVAGPKLETLEQITRSAEHRDAPWGRSPLLSPDERAAAVHNRRAMCGQQRARAGCSFPLGRLRSWRTRGALPPDARDPLWCQHGPSRRSPGEQFFCLVRERITGSALGASSCVSFAAAEISGRPRLLLALRLRHSASRAATAVPPRRHPAALHHSCAPRPTNEDAVTGASADQRGRLVGCESRGVVCLLSFEDWVRRRTARCVLLREVAFSRRS